MKWPMVNIEDIFDVARGGSPRPIDDFITDDPDGVNWIMIGDTKEGGKYIESTGKKIRPEGVSKSRMVHEGDFLLTNSMSFGRPYILKTSGCIHDGWLVLSPKSSEISTDYFYYYLGSQEIKNKLSSKAAGAVVKNLNKDIVKSLEIPLPPLAEQQRIAAILDKADAIRRKRQQAIQLADEFLRAVFQHHSCSPLALKPMTDIYDGYEWVKLSEVARLESGHTPSRKRDDYWGGDIKWLSLKDVKSMNGAYLYDTQDKPTQLGIDNSSARVLPKGTVALCRTASVGKCVILGDDMATSQDYVNWVCGSRIIPEFLYATLLISDRFFDGLKQGSTHKTIYVPTVKDFHICLPPMDIQEKISNALKRVVGFKVQAVGSVVDLAAFSGALSQKAFKGEL